mgnify:CR=1 FL=1
MKELYEMYASLGVSREVYEFGQSVLDSLKARFEGIDAVAEYNQAKVIRAMQEQGDVSYWSIIFGAKTFSEMLNRVSMVEEIAQSDQRMLENMRQIATEVLSAKEELAGEKVSLEEKKTELAEWLGFWKGLFGTATLPEVDDAVKR